MSYNAQGGGTLIIKKENFEAVIAAYRKWTKDDTDEVKTIDQVFGAQNFAVCYDTDGNVADADFPDNYYSDTDTFIRMLAPWIENGSSLDFSGEDNSQWRISIFNHEYIETTGKVIYPGDPYSDRAEIAKWSCSAQ